MTPPVACGPRVNLFGRPSIDGQCTTYRMRSRKSWALLAYLVLNERPPTRHRLAALLYDEADDPLRALRWGLSEVRRALRGLATIEGDPVVLRRHPALVFDVEVVTGGPWASAVRVPTLGHELLEGISIRSAAVFDSWLLAEQRRLAAAADDVLREAVRALVERGDHRAAIGYAVRRVAIRPLEEDGHVELIRLYRAIGDDVAAQRQFASYASALETQLGIGPGPALLAALDIAAEPAA